VETPRARHAVGVRDTARAAYARDARATAYRQCCAEAAADTEKVLISGWVSDVQVRGRDQTRAAKHTRRRLVMSVLERDGRRNLGRASPRGESRERKCRRRARAADEVPPKLN
jgi:hypothetical protein